MDWLLENPLANMYGPTFLWVYAFLIVFLIFVHRYKLKALDWTAKLPLPQIPLNPDPYEIAYLRGGENEVTRSVIFALTQRGFLTHTTDFLRNQSTFAKTGKAQDIQTLSRMERDVLYFFTEPKSAYEIFQSDGITNVVNSHCLQYEGKLLNENLLNPPEIKSAAERNAGIAATVILLIGGFKLITALMHGRTNVLFLILMAIAGLIILYYTTRVPRLSHRGRAYLEALQTAFVKLKYPPKTNSNIQTPKPSPTFAAVDPLLLGVGVFGVGALAGTNYDYMNDTFRKSAMQDGASSSSSSSCGTGCGSSSCSSSSCSGGSSCGSSCGGGCGGGCGG